MTPAVAALLLAAGLAAAPDGWRLRAAFASPQLERALPVDALLLPAPRLYLVFHREPEWARAFYTPPESSVDGMRGRQVERLLPGLAAPRLFLAAAAYRPAGRWRPVETLPVDLAEQLFHALLEARLDRGLAASELRRVDRRAALLLGDLPEPSRRSAYLAAVADFAAHLLSIANEVERHRRSTPDAALCPLVDPPRALFALWESSFAQGEFRGGYGAPAGGGGPIVWKLSRGALAVEDKRWVVGPLLGTAWTGSAGRDFAALCAAP